LIRALQTDVHHARPTDNKISLLAITWHKGRRFKSEVTSLHLLAATPYVLFTLQWQSPSTYPFSPQFAESMKLQKPETENCKTRLFPFKTGPKQCSCHNLLS
jgi:hypothetical protein